MALMGGLKGALSAILSPRVGTRSSTITSVIALCGLLMATSVLAAESGVSAPLQGINIEGYRSGHSVTPLAEVFLANTATDNLVSVKSLWQHGEVSRHGAGTIAVGMSQQPVWVRLPLLNPTDQLQRYTLIVGASWVDYIDVFQLAVDGDKVTRHWQTGDEVAGAPFFEPAAGYVIDLHLPPGTSDVFIRSQSVDPLILTLHLSATDNVAGIISSTGHAYGLLYGFLLAFILYNLILFNALKQKRLLFYALYLLTFVLMNLSYTGRSLAWLWAEYPAINRYAMPFFMVMLPFSGLCFARSALDIARFVPRVDSWVRRFQWGGLLLLLPSIVFDWHELAAWIGFGMLTLFIPLMVVLGVVMLRFGQIFSRYFLAAAIVAMAGSALTEFAIWGFIPFTALTYHAMEFGMMLDATILAVGLSQHVRYQQKQKLQAERLARQDSLTQLFNRRGFYEQAELQCALAVRHKRPFSIIIIDLDYFKQLNDNYGHSVGDRTLVEFAKLISANLRVNDVAARWGGEEFVIMLPETHVAEASVLAERFREMTQCLSVEEGFSAGELTASFGVVEMAPGQSLEAMLSAADAALYQAKAKGRNRIEIAPEDSVNNVGVALQG